GAILEGQTRNKSGKIGINGYLLLEEGGALQPFVAGFSIPAYAQPDILLVVAGEFLYRISAGRYPFRQAEDLLAGNDLALYEPAVLSQDPHAACFGIGCAHLPNGTQNSFHQVRIDD